ncbi:MAG: PD-(D/E)XK nuclease family protein [Thermoplasmatota archaeon]
MKCPDCNTSDSVVKDGTRDTKLGEIQKYHCKKCDKYFSEKKLPNTQCPPKVIFYTLEQYNRGYPVKKAKTRTGKKYHNSPPTRTIYSWINKYRDTLTFLKLRKKFGLNPDELTTTHRFRHQQIYPFTYHDLKLHLSAKDFPQLRRYISWVERSLEREMFLKGPRASSMTIENELKANEKDTIAQELCRYALLTQRRKESPHEAVERFFLINDSKTICSELPVFLNPDETERLDIDTPLTGHIDLIQWRFGNLYIMDYKSNLKYPETHTSQLYWYKEALHQRTSIPKNKIIPAVFNEHGYYELKK